MVECEDLTQNRMYGKVVFQYQSAMTASGGQRRESLRCQGELIEALANLAKSIKQMRDTKRVCKQRKYHFASCIVILRLDTNAVCSF